MREINLLQPPPGYEVQFGQYSESEWNRILLQFDDSVLYQTWAYGAVRWGERNLGHVLVTRNGQPAGAAQVRLARVPGLGAGVAYAAWAPLFRPKGKGQDLEAYRQVLRGLRAACAEDLGLSLRLRPQNRGSGSDDVRRLLAAEGFVHQQAGESYRTIEMDISLPAEELRRNTTRQWRQHLQRGEEHGLDFVDGTDPEYYGDFMKLYGEMKEFKQFVSFVDAEEVGNIQDRLVGPLRMRIAVVRSGQQPLSALVYSALGDTAVGVLAATGQKGRELYSSYIVWWRVVELLKSRGIRHFDLGGIDEVRAPGPAHFKTGLAGKSGQVIEHIGQFDAPGGRLSRLCLGLGASLQGTYRRLRMVANQALHRGAPTPAASASAKPRGPNKENTR